MTLLEAGKGGHQRCRYAGPAQTLGPPRQYAPSPQGILPLSCNAMKAPQQGMMMVLATTKHNPHLRYRRAHVQLKWSKGPDKGGPCVLGSHEQPWAFRLGGALMPVGSLAGACDQQSH